MTTDPRVQAVAEALWEPLNLPLNRPHAADLAAVAVEALDKYDFECETIEGARKAGYRVRGIQQLRERIAQEIIEEGMRQRNDEDYPISREELDAFYNAADIARGGR